MFRILAILLEVIATNSCRVKRPVSTPSVQRTDNLSSSPLLPFGILDDGREDETYTDSTGQVWEIADHQRQYL